MAVDYLPTRRYGADPFVGQERASMHTLALGVDCPYCSAGIGSPCYDPRNGRVLSWRLPAHTPRIRAASSEHTYEQENHDGITGEREA